MQWSDRLSTGISTVDEQHRQLLQAFNELQEAMRAGKGAEAVLRTLRFLGEYATVHFGTEERLMRAYRYPGLDAHRAEHDSFRADFTRILRETEATPHRVAKTMEVSRELLEWLYTHISGTDKRMGTYLVGKGVS